MRLLASAAPRRTNHEMSRPTTMPDDADEKAIHHSRTVPVARRQTERPAGMRRPPMTNVGTPISRPLRDLDEGLSVEASRAKQLEVARAALGLHLAHPVEVAQVHGDVLQCATTT